MTMVLFTHKTIIASTTRLTRCDNHHPQTTHLQPSMNKSNNTHTYKLTHIHTHTHTYTYIQPPTN